MQSQKKLTLQQYIECHNIKKQLQERSKQKSRSKSRDKSTSSQNVLLQATPNQNPTQTSFSANLRQTNYTPFNMHSHEELNKSIYDQVDFRSRNLYAELYASMNQIKIQCRAIILNDKDFAYFIKLLDALMQKFRQGIMHIHRQNLILFQISNEPDKNASQSRDELTRTFLQKSFDDRWNESRTQYESNANFIPTKSIKQKMNETRKGQQLIKNLFGGLNQQNTFNKSKKFAPKIYDHEPRNQQQRLQRKKQAIDFLGFIMGNIGYGKNIQKQNESNEPQKQINSQALPLRHPALKENKLTPNNSNNQGQKFVKNINFLNSSERVNINTQDIDIYYDNHNTSFGIDSPILPLAKHTKSKDVKNISKSPTKEQTRKQKMAPIRNEKPPMSHEIKTARYNPTKQVKIVSKSPPSNIIQGSRPQQILRRNNSKSKGKAIKGLIQRNYN